MGFLGQRAGGELIGLDEDSRIIAGVVLPNQFVRVLWLGAAAPAVGVLSLGIGLIVA